MQKSPVNINTGRVRVQHTGRGDDGLQMQVSVTKESKLRDQIIATIRDSVEQAPSFGNPIDDLEALGTQRQMQRLPGNPEETQAR